MPAPPDEPNIDELIERNAAYADGFADAGVPVVPRRHLAVVACMDSRMDIFQLLGLENGEAHIIRNAGGVITDDVIRSLCISQRFLETRGVILVHHTDCGLSKVSEETFKADLEAELGVKPWWSLETFSDPYADVLQSLHRIQLTPFVRYKDQLRGFVYDVDTGRLHEVLDES
jgi:carbonic anhydrase